MQAYIDGEIIPVGGPHQYNIDVGNQDITSNVAGSLISSEFALGGLYAGTAYCNTPMTNQPVFSPRVRRWLNQAITPAICV